MMKVCQKDTEASSKELPLAKEEAIWVSKYINIVMDCNPFNKTGSHEYLQTQINEWMSELLRNKIFT